MNAFVGNLDWMTILPFALFGAAAAGIWFLLDLMTAKTPKAVQRLDELNNPALRKNKDEELPSKSKLDTLAKALKSASPALSKPLTPRTDKEANNLKANLSYAGFRSEGAATTYLSIKFVCLVAGLFFSGGMVFLCGGLPSYGLLKIIMIIVGFFYLPTLVLKFLVKRRQDAIFLGLPDSLDLMVVCVEAGLALDQSMRKVAEEMKKAHRIVAEEFAVSNFQLQMGRPRNEVLSELGERTGVDDLQSLATILIQADKFGSSVAQALRVQSNAMRTKRHQLAEEKAAKTAVQLIFPLVLFIFPGIFVVLVGPAAITMINEMLPVLKGG